MLPSMFPSSPLPVLSFPPKKKTRVTRAEGQGQLLRRIEQAARGGQGRRLEQVQCSGHLGEKGDLPHPNLDAYGSPTPSIYCNAVWARQQKTSTVLYIVVWVRLEAFFSPHP